MTQDAPLRVLCSFREPRQTTNPYIVMLLRELQSTDGLQVAPFTFGAAVRQRWDVFHSHWPEVLITGGSRWRRLGRQAAFALMLMAFTVRGTTIVQTVHNLRPHEAQSPIVRWLLRRLGAMTTQRIALNAQTAAVSGDECVEIPHGDYIDWFAEHPGREREVGRVLFAGLIRPYKNVDGLIEAFRSSQDAGLRLQILGRCEDRGLADTILRSAADDPRIEVDLRFIADPELADAITGAGVVALPYRDLHNSGAALLALSLARPILVPDNEVTRALGREVGDEWVTRFEGELGAVDVEQAARRPLPDGSPDLGRRRWDAVGRAHRDVYRSAVSAKRGADRHDH